MKKARIASLVGLVSALAAVSASAADVKRVLVVHSFGSATPPFATRSTAFEATLTQVMGGRIDLDEVSLDMARYAQPDMEDAFVAFLKERLEKWQPDLVVPVGSPAGRFVNKYRHHLFPRTPVVYAGMDRRTLPPGPLENAAFIGESFDLPGVVEDILQVAPETRNIAVVSGASPLERFWTAEFRRAFQPFSDRVTFAWLNDLSFDQMLERVASLPPRSFILLVLLVRDASGVTHNQDQALRRLRAAANAPINGLFSHQLGLGIVGGRLYRADLQGVEAAHVAVRVLDGEPASSIPERIIPPDAPRYDWRELQRWNIREDRLPPGSLALFRQPTIWERHRGWIVGGLALVLLQAGLIGLLIVNLVKRRHVSRALQQSEERMKLAAESAGAGLWSVDLATGKVWATPRLCALFQFDPGEELSYERFLAAAHPDDRERVRGSFDAAVNEGRALTVEFRLAGTDGRQWVLTRGHADGDHGARPTRLSGESVDITERRLAEDRVRESESRFRSVADSAPVYIWVSGLDKGCTFVNQPWLDFTGRTAEQEHGEGWAESVHPEDRPGTMAAYVEAFDARQPFAVQYRLRRRDGEYRWILANGVPRYDAGGSFVGYIGSCLDVTERLQAEERFRQVFEAAPNAMIMVREGGTIALANAQVEKVFGYGREELIGLSIETLVPAALRPEHAGHWDRYRDAPGIRAMGPREVFGRRKDGSEVPVEVGLSPIRTTEGLFIVASATDISERQQAEAETRALRDELAHISRVATVGELTAAIVHELGQPLAAILANAQAGLRLLASGDGDGDELREVLEDVVAADRRAAQVIRHLRSLLRKGQAERHPLRLNQLIEDVVNVVLPNAHLRRVSVSLELAPALPRVLGDRVQLQQVLLNLFVNAFEAMTEVTDRPRRLIVCTRALDEGRVEVEVADTGPGIAAEDLDSIFSPFVTSKKSGMGMGLSVSQTIVQAHEGRLWAENGREGGAIFHVVLPELAQAEASFAADRPVA